MHLTINGQNREFAELSAGSSMAHLVEILGLKGDRVAIELNGLIVSRASWTSTQLAPQDKLEVVHFVGGGALGAALAAAKMKAFPSMEIPQGFYPRCVF